MDLNILKNFNYILESTCVHECLTFNDKEQRGGGPKMAEE